VRMVDPESESYLIANRYMIRLRRDDFDDPHELARFAATANLSLQEFHNQFFYVVAEGKEEKAKGNGHALQRAMQEVEEKEEKKEK